MNPLSSGLDVRALDGITPLTLTERCNLRAVAANRCTAEQAAVGLCSIEEPKGASGAGAVLYERGLLGCDEKRNLCGDEYDQFVRRVDPAALHDLYAVLGGHRFAVDIRPLK